MVTQGIVAAYAWFVALLGSFVNFPAVPSFVSEAAGFASTIGGYVASTGSWIPWPIMSATLAAYGVCLAAALLVKTARIIASFVTLGGGSAA